LDERVVVLGIDTDTIVLVYAKREMERKEDLKLRIADCGLGILDCGLRIVDWDGGFQFAIRN